MSLLSIALCTLYYFLFGLFCVNQYKSGPYYVKTPRSLSVLVRIGILFLYPILIICLVVYYSIRLIKDVLFDE